MRGLKKQEINLHNVNIMRLIASALLLLLVSTSGFTQTPNKKDSKVIVIPTDTVGVFTRLNIVLFQRGYTIDIKDDDLKYIVTKVKNVKNVLTKVRAIVNDSSVVLTGEIASNILVPGQSFDPIQYGGMKGSPLMNSWDELVTIAKLLGEKVYYSK